MDSARAVDLEEARRCALHTHGAIPPGPRPMAGG
jgi:hypothetical protein